MEEDVREDPALPENLQAVNIPVGGKDTSFRGVAPGNVPMLPETALSKLL